MAENEFQESYFESRLCKTPDSLSIDSAESELFEARTNINSQRTVFITLQVDISTIFRVFMCLSTKLDFLIWSGGGQGPSVVSKFRPLQYIN